MKRKNRKNMIGYSRFELLTANPIFSVSFRSLLP
jgi:hypothetical protein